MSQERPPEGEQNRPLGAQLQEVIVRQLAEGVVLVRAADQRIVYANPRFEHLFGYAAGELEGQHASVLSYGGAPDVEQLERALDGLGEVVVELHNRRKDGSEFWTRARAARVEHPELGSLWLSVQEDITAARQVAARLKRQDQLLETLLQGLPVATMICDRQGRVTRANPATKLLWGRSRDLEPDEYGALEVWLPDGQPVSVDDLPLTRALRDGQASTGVELRFETLVGEILSVRVAALPLFDEAGRPDGAVLVVEDLTALESSRARFEDIVRSTTEAILTLDQEGRIDFANPGACQLLDVTGDGLLGVPAEFFIDDVHRAFFRDEVHSMLAGEEPAGREWTLAARTATGSSIVVEVRLARRGLAAGLTLAMRDETLRHQLVEDQQLLAEAGALLSISLDPAQTLSDLAALAVRAHCEFFLMDTLTADGTAVRVQAAAAQPAQTPLVLALREPAQPASSEAARRVFLEGEALLGGTGDETLLAELFPRPEDLKLIRLLGIHSWAVVPLTARGRIHGALTFLSAAPGRWYGEYELSLMRGLAGRAAIALDNAQLLAEAQAATHAREQLLSIVAHDLRSPLQSVRMAAELLLRRLEAGGVPDVAPVQAIGRAAVRMDRLIGDLLDWARIGAGNLSVEPRPLDVAPLLDEVMETIRPQAGAHRLRMRADPQLPRVLGDRGRLVQVLINLLSNALKFTPPGGAVALSAEPAPEGGVTFSVSDSGPGVTAEQRARIFDPFWQLAPGDRRGIGLGLTISQGLVRAHGSQLQLSSHPGRGSRFFFTLPPA